MDLLEQQLEQEKINKKEKLKDLFYVDYCNNCKDPSIRGVYGKHYTPCHHPWYCWHDGGEVQALEFRLAQLREIERTYPFFPAREKEELRKLKERKWELIKESRRSMPRIKHEKR